MKTERLIEILRILKKGKSTAPQLAEALGVSRRTVNRDIEEIINAGISVETAQGVGGGVALAEGYSLLPDNMLRELLEKSADAAANKPKNPISAYENINLDLPEELAEKLSVLEEALAGRKRVKFRIYDPSGFSEKTVEPAAITLREDGFHLSGYCVESGGFIDFLLSRICNLLLTAENFEPKKPPAAAEAEQKPREELIITALYSRSEAYRLVEKYGRGSFVPMGKGLYSKLSFDSYDSAVSWFLSFGEKVKILSPEDFRLHLMQEAGRILAQYR